MARVRMAVVGVGHLGKEHARILAGLPEVELVGVADQNPQQAQTVGQKLNVPAYSGYWPLLNLVDAACIVVPTTGHGVVAGEFLKREIPVLVEKPLASSAQEAGELVRLAREHETILQVGHIERFNPAYQELKKIRLRPRFIRAERYGAFSGRAADVGVVLDLMIHDLDLMLDLVDAPVDRVEALGISTFGGHEDIANARLHFANGCIAEVSASRVHPTPSRQMQIWAPEGYAHLDFGQRKLTLVQPSAEVRQQGLNPAKLDPASRSRIREELFTRYLETAHREGQAVDQLTAELKHFVQCVQTGKQPTVGGQEGFRALELAEKVIVSLNHHAWNGVQGGPQGPHHLPAPLGLLFQPAGKREVA